MILVSFSNLNDFMTRLVAGANSANGLWDGDGCSPQVTATSGHFAFHLNVKVVEGTHVMAWCSR